jgi:hypothetical protein
MRSTLGRRVAVRLAQVGLGLLSGLVVSEVVLQIAAVFTWSLRGGHHEGVLGPGRRVVFLGDSNTFGLGAGFDNSYPQVLQRRWKRRGGNDQPVIINLGTPGLNSSKLRQQLPGILTTLRPDTLFIMIGVNDLWTAAAPLTGEAGDWHYRLWKYSRVYRFLYMLSKVPQSRSAVIDSRDTPDGRRVAVADEVELIWTRKMNPQDSRKTWPGDLQWNLKSMITDAQLLGVETILLTYPSDSGWYGTVNELIRGTARLTDTPVVDLGAAFREVCPGQRCPDLILADQHPTVRGHQLAADVLWKYFATLPGAQLDSVTATGPATPPRTTGGSAEQRTTQAQERAPAPTRAGGAPGAAAE